MEAVAPTETWEEMLSAHRAQYITVRELAALMRRSESAVRSFLKRRGVRRWQRSLRHALGVGEVELTDILVYELHAEMLRLAPRIRRHAVTHATLERRLLGALDALAAVETRRGTESDVLGAGSVPSTAAPAPAPQAGGDPARIPTCSIRRRTGSAIAPTVSAS